MLVVPLSAVPNQTIVVSLGQQACRLNVRQKRTGMFADILVNEQPVVLGVICQNLNPLVRGEYLGFAGNLCFVDNQGSDDPDYTGLGSRFSLVYSGADEVPAGLG
jgi:hypothetical protein